MTLKQLKQFALFAILFVPFLGMAQGQTSTPYSFFGIGDINEQGNIRAFGMGGTGLAVRSNQYIYFDNPASYNGIDSLSFVAGAGAQSTMGSYRTNEQSSDVSLTTVNHLSFAFPITNWWKSSIALIPFSNVGYEVREDVTTDAGFGTQNVYSGDGGLDRINWGNAIKITKNFSVGINSSYYFGRIEHMQTVLFPDSAYIYNSRYSDRSLLSGFQFTLGTQLFIPTGENSTFGIAATYTPTTKLNIKTDYLAITYFGDVGTETSIDTIYYGIGMESKATLPYAYGIGLSWEKKNQLLMAFDFKFDNWQSFSYRNQTTNLSNKIKASFGIEFIPTSNNLSSYLKLIHYRFGARYNKMGLQFNNNTLEEYAISIGFGLPLRKSSTVVNLGMEIGQNGTIENNLIQERFFKIALGISIREKWFRKGKYF